MLSQPLGQGCRRAAAAGTSKVASTAAVQRPAVLLHKTHHLYRCKAAAVPQQLQPELALHFGDTTMQLPFTAIQGQQLDAALAKLLQTFAEKQQAKRPRRWDMMEVRFAGPEAGEGLELIEVFCNPNAHATAFDAKLLVTIKAAGGLKVMCEGRLSAVKADLDAFMSACSSSN